MSEDEMINVEVAYALPDKQRIIALRVARGCTVYEAAAQSGICEQFPEIDLATSKLGVFGMVVTKPKESPLQEGDRVEIYRPLLADPKEVRKARAAKVKARKAGEEQP